MGIHKKDISNKRFGKLTAFKKMSIFIEDGHKLKILYKEDVMQLLPKNFTYKKYLNQFNKR